MAKKKAKQIKNEHVLPPIEILMRDMRRLGLWLGISTASVLTLAWMISTFV
ncbi:hypothetical protein [Mechercharimyces sp. CAU 1602]|uniref:hypothetical protein n=1 Tax=Mechercharimyces sp. CAU 1602 TaxID=2973933 RepID=UPI002162E5D9|nr:hypothetical protein [Mechercharimyces sp. CAU 1602]MCS1352036.1 hypothetical protein [Mechercharimyces sp. CAU 1602]